MHSEAKTQWQELPAFLNLHLQYALVERQHAPSPESSVRTVVGGSRYNLDAYSPKEAGHFSCPCSRQRAAQHSAQMCVGPRGDPGVQHLALPITAPPDREESSHTSASLRRRWVTAETPALTPKGWQPWVCPSLARPRSSSAAPALPVLLPPPSSLRRTLPSSPCQPPGSQCLGNPKRQHAPLVYEGWARSPKDCRRARRCHKPLRTNWRTSAKKDNWVRDLPVTRKGMFLTRTLHVVNKPCLKPKYRLRKTVLHCIYLFNKYKESRVNRAGLFCENTMVGQRQKRAFGFNSSFIYARYR